MAAANEDSRRKEERRAFDGIVTLSTTAEGAEQKFTFRGEAKPIDLPDTPPVALSGADDDGDEGPQAAAE